jgi:hypothetical protein
MKALGLSAPFDETVCSLWISSVHPYAETVSPPLACPCWRASDAFAFALGCFPPQPNHFGQATFGVVPNFSSSLTGVYLHSVCCRGLCAHSEMHSNVGNRDKDAAEVGSVPCDEQVDPCWSSGDGAATVSVGADRLRRHVSRFAPCRYIVETGWYPRSSLAVVYSRMEAQRVVCAPNKCQVVLSAAATPSPTTYLSSLQKRVRLT